MGGGPNHGAWPMTTNWKSRAVDQRTVGCRVRVIRIELGSFHFAFDENDGPLCLL